MSAHYEFKWPKGPEEVIVTGTIDNWSKSTPLFKHADGSFTLQVPLPVQKEPILYKYIVDGTWRVNPDEKITKDFEGNENNVLDSEDLQELVTIPGALIPESGLISNHNHQSTTGALDRKDITNKDTSTDVTAAPAGSSDYKSTVLPKEEPHQTSLTGEPGIHIPKDEEQLAVFDQYESTDPTTLNKDVKEVGTAGDAVPSDSKDLSATEEHKDSTTADAATAGKEHSDADIAAVLAAAGAAGTGAGLAGSTGSKNHSTATGGAVSSEPKDVSTSKQPEYSSTTGATAAKEHSDADIAAVLAAAGAAGVGAGAIGAGAIGAGADSEAAAGTSAAESSSVPSTSGGDNLKKVKRVQYKAKPKKDTTEIDQGTDSNTASKDAKYVSIPTAIETGNETSGHEYLNDNTKVTPDLLKKEAADNDKINKEVRDEYEAPTSKDVTAPGVVGTNDAVTSSKDAQAEPEQEKSDHSTAKALGAGVLGGLGGAGLGSALASESNQHTDGVARGDYSHGPYTTSKDATQSTSVDPYTSTTPVVATGNEVPKTLDPKAGQEEPAAGTTAPSTLASEPEIKPVTGSTLDAGEGKEVNASPVAKDQAPYGVASGATGATAVSKSRVSGPAAPGVVNDEDEEEEIIIARGNEQEILAAIEATEGHDVTLEEITPTKSEQERLTKEAELAAQVDGPITIEKVEVPEDEILSATSKDKTSAKSATSSTKEPKRQTASDVPVKKSRADKKQEENGKKKKGFRSFLKKIVS
ncbi:CRP1 [Candida theae]|uniref:CRP1 n=1 Tax=Candida theae TaxID=1198502 RepID=A0AAD5G057_9ASCO|nr:CRP1 [Candida theae]KAI5964004.1 CRP1 [Candida theae]